MRKIFLLAFFLSGSFLQALATNNPMAPAMIREGFFFSTTSSIGIRAAYEGSFVFDRRMEQEGKAGRIDGLKMDTHLGWALCNLWDRVDIFGGAGQGRIRSDWRVDFPEGTISRIDMESHYGLTWTVGANGLCYQWKELCVSIGGRYEESKPEILWMTKNGEPFTFGNESHVEWKEWQVNSSLSYKIDFLVPYIGVKYSDVHAEVKTFQEGLLVPIAHDGGASLKIESRKNWGMVLGCGISNSKYFQLNVEARLFDEEGGAVYGDFRF
jgi:hypothetical protein